jgi:hypothetical protein
VLKHKQFVFENDKSDLEVHKYELLDPSNTRYTKIAYFIPSHSAWFVYQFNTPDEFDILFGVSIEDIFGQSMRVKYEGIIEEDNAMIFRLMLKAKEMMNYGLEYLKTNTELFLKKEIEMPRTASTKIKIETAEVKRSGALLRAKQLVAYLDKQDPSAVANAKKIAEYISGLHDDADPASVIQCSVVKAVTAKTPTKV